MSAPLVLEKRCAKCRQVKPGDAFARRARSGDGLQYYCRDCLAAFNKSTRVNRGPTPRPPTGGTKKCPTCRAELPYEAFYANRTRRDGLSVYCRDCHRARLHGSLTTALRAVVHLARVKYGAEVGAWLPEVIVMLRRVAAEEPAG